MIVSNKCVWVAPGPAGPAALSVEDQLKQMLAVWDLCLPVAPSRDTVTPKCSSQTWHHDTLRKSWNPHAPTIGSDKNLFYFYLGNSMP